MPMAGTEPLDPDGFFRAGTIAVDGTLCQRPLGKPQPAFGLQAFRQAEASHLDPI